MIGQLGAEIGFWSFHRNWWKYTQPPIILISAYILACQAGTNSWYSTGGTPPIKAEQPGLCPHLGSAWERGNISTRIWTRALQPVQEEVSSWRFRRAQTVSGPPTFSRSADISPAAEISTPAKILSSAYISARRQHFVNPPTFSWDANILGIRQYLHETLTFWESANIFMRCQYFGNPPIFSWDANILGFCLNFVKAQIIYEFAWSLLLQIFVYIFSIYLCIYSGRGKFMPLPLKSKILETPGFLVTGYIKMFPLWIWTLNLQASLMVQCELSRICNYSANCPQSDILPLWVKKKSFQLKRNVI